MATNTTASAKTHVSLRLPTYILESIDAHAEKESISRTEAFVFYLQTGLDIADTKADEPSKDESMLMAIQDELAEIKALLQGDANPVVREQTVQSPDQASENADIELSPEKKEAEREAEEAAAEEYAEVNFTASDAVFEAGRATGEDEKSTESSAFGGQATPEAPAEAEEIAEEDFSDSDALTEESASEAVSSLYAIGDTENFTEIKPLADPSEFTTSDATYEETAGDEDAEMDEAASFAEDEDSFSTSDAIFEDESDADAEEEDEVLSQKKLEKAVAKAAKDIASIEKIWLYGPAAESKEITDAAIDLCVKAEDDEKIKSKHLEAFVEALEAKTGKVVSVVLKNAVDDEETKQALKNKIVIYKA